MSGAVMRMIQQCHRNTQTETRKHELYTFKQNVNLSQLKT